MPENPFAILSRSANASGLPESPTETTVATKPPVPANAVMVYDFETVPDESRFPRPKLDPTASSVPTLDVEQFFTVCKTVTEISKYLAKNPLSTEQYDALLVVEQRAEKPRKGVFDEIESCKAAATSAFDDWKKDCSTNPLKARIVAFGWALGNGEIESMTATDDSEERLICEKFWSLVGTGRRRCGYNITGFDDMLIGIRSILLGVEPSMKLARKKYGNHQAIDLMTLLFPNSTAQKLKDVCVALGIVIPAGADMDGSKVFDLFSAGMMGEIAAYVRSDVSVERELMWRLQSVFSE